MTNDKKTNLFVKYRKIILAVALFLIADFLVIGINFYSTYKAGESAVSINLSGRQRMLSQRMTKVLLLMQRTHSAKNQEAIATNLKELTLAVGLFDSTLKGFSEGDTVTGGDMKPVYLVKVDTEKSRQAVDDAYKLWLPYRQLLQPFLSQNKEFSEGELREKAIWVSRNHKQLEAAVAYAQKNNLEILRLMNDLTTELESVANKRAATLRIVLFTGIIFALVNFGYTVIISIRDLLESDEELAKARYETLEILSTVREGLFLLDKNIRIGSQFSKSLPQILKRDIEPGSDFLPHMKAITPPNVYEAAVDYIELLLGDKVKEALVASINPLTSVPIAVTDTLGNPQTRYLSFFFNRVMQEGQFSHILVTVQDVTDKVVLTQQIDQAKNLAKTEVEALLRLAGGNFETLQQFVTGLEQSLAQINEKLSVPHDDERERLHTLNYIMRLVHSIKGEAASLGIESLEGYAHECEKEMVVMREHEESFSGDDMLRIAVLLEGFYERYSSLEQIVSRLGSVLGKAKMKAESAVVLKHPLTEQITTLAKRIAADYGKKVEVSCQLEVLSSLPEPLVQELQSISIQLVRNALTHGIEMPDKRISHNKSPTGALRVSCEYLCNGQYEFVVQDDGQGIVPARLRAHFAKTQKLDAKEAAAMSDDAIMTHIFLPGISTADVADKDAGHGIGLDVVREKIHHIGGRLHLKSRPNQFTKFRIQFSATSQSQKK